MQQGRKDDDLSVAAIASPDCLMVLNLGQATGVHLTAGHAMSY